MIKEKIRNPYKISEFFFGENDGEKEATYHKDFGKYFYTGTGYQQRLDNIKYWLVLGRKGTGKSILGHYFHKQRNDKQDNFSEVVSYRDFKYNLLVQLEDNDIKPNQYISIWKFTLLVYLGKLLLSNEGLKSEDEYLVLQEFIDQNFSLGVNQNKILELAIDKQINGGVLGVGGSVESKTRYEKGNYLNYLEELEKLILSLINKGNYKYFLILDDLDDRFRRNKDNKDALISLIKAVNYINLNIVRSGEESKIITLLRTDIFSYLNDPDLNKIKSDNGVVINWGNIVSKDSELFKMLIYKIKASKEDLKNYSDEQIFDMLFPQDISFKGPNGEYKYISPEKFFLERTFFRPRDIIAYIKSIVTEYENTKFIGYAAFKELERDYSNYLLSEIENELIGHFEDEYIKEGLRFLKQFKKNSFKYEDIKLYLDENKTRFPGVNIDDLLKIFFEFGILANMWIINDKPFYSSVIRDDKAEIDYNKTFVLHLGLRKAILY